MIKSIAAAGIIAMTFAAPSFAQTAMEPVMCDDAGMTKLKSEAQTVKQEYESEAKAAIGDATIAMQQGNTDACVMAMEKAYTAIHK